MESVVDFWDCRAEVLGSVTGISENDFGNRAGDVLKEGPFPEMVAFAMSLPAEERAKLSIVRPGSAFIGREEIEKLAARPDYPGAGPD